MLSRRRVDELLRALGERTPTPASGAATALTAAMAAALAELAARFAGDEDAAGRAHALADELVRLGDEDGAAYSAFMAERTPAARRRIIAVPEEIAARAEDVALIADRLARELRTSVAGDAEAAGELARTAARVARRLAEINRSSES